MYEVTIEGVYGEPTGSGNCLETPFITTFEIPECSEESILSHVQNRFLLKHLKREMKTQVRFVATAELVSFEKNDKPSGLAGKNIFKLTRDEIDLFACEYDENDIIGLNGDIKRNRAKCAWYYSVKTGIMNADDLPIREYLTDISSYEQDELIIEDDYNDIKESMKTKKLKRLPTKPAKKKAGRPAKKEANEFKKL